MTDKIKESLELIGHYAEEHWWFDPDLIIHESMDALLAERGRLQAENEQKELKLLDCTIERSEAWTELRALRKHQELLEKVLEAIEGIKEIRPYQAKRKLEQALAAHKEQT